MIKQIPLSQLIISAQNVRKTGLNEGLDELKASIQHHGLQQNLVVTAEPENQYAVIAGGRRLRALQALMHESMNVANCITTTINGKADWLIPCQIADAKDATEVSLAENTVRVAMHPADQFEAWKQMIEDGKTIMQVAARFGVSEDLVQRRLKLAHVSPRLLQEYRAEEMTLECLMAFTLCDDYKRQEAVWSELSASVSLSPYQIRNALTTGSVPDSSKLAQFVGVEAFEAAGGYITRDLFQEVAYFEDAALLQKLAEQKLESVAADLRNKWQWVTVMLDRDYTTFNQYSQLEKTPVNAPESLIVEYRQKQHRLMSLENGDYETSADESLLQNEYNELSEAVPLLKNKLDEFLSYIPEDCAKAGCIIFIEHDGSLGLREGLVKRESNNNTAEFSADNSTDTPTAPSSCYSQSLKEDLSIYRTQVLQTAISNDFSAAFDLLVFTLCNQVFGAEYSKAVDITGSSFRPKTVLDDANKTKAAVQRMLQKDGLSLAWMEQSEEKFSHFCSLTDAEKQALFSYCTAEMITNGLAGKMHVGLEHTATKLSVDVRASWRPNDANFFNRLKKVQLLDLVEELLGDDWKQRLSDHKKSALANWLNRLFSGDANVTAGIDAILLQRVQQWLPDGMAFSTTEDDASVSAEVISPDSSTEDARPDMDTDEVSLPAWMIGEASAAA